MCVHVPSGSNEPFDILSTYVAFTTSASVRIDMAIQKFLRCTCLLLQIARLTTQQTLISLLVVFHAAIDEYRRLSS